MENLKIHVKNEAESKEAQELFFKLGYDWFGGSKSIIKSLPWIYCGGSLLSHCSNAYNLDHGFNLKEITLQGLRNMLEPQHKEYLDPRNNYELIEWDGGFMIQDHWIEVPMGAEILSSFNNGQSLIFHKQDLNYVVGTDKDWNKLGVSYEYFRSYFPLAVILWQRDAQPSAMNADEDSADELFASASLESTLAERQASYGDFEDVAYTTESLVDVLKKANYDKMTKEQKMALYMICSKMARLVNGDCNHKDSWHDIAGYAKLVEDSL